MKNQLKKLKEYNPSKKDLKTPFIEEPMEHYITQSRVGMPFIAFENIVHTLPFTKEEWSNILQLSERTLQRYEKEKKLFDTVQSEKILFLNILLRKGNEIFGSTEKFYEYLQSPIMALGGTKPKDLLDTHFGMQLVLDEMGRIEHGIFA